jgi:excinuclease UvrABC nuclease subunit
MMIGNEFVYVGKAQSGLRTRLAQHYYNEPTRDSSYSEYQIRENRDVMDVIWSRMSSKQECVEIEKILIRLFEPLWNNRLTSKQ